MAINKQSGAWALVYCPANNTFLMGKRSQSVKKPCFWNFFGGRVEASEDARAAVLRELYEEAGFTEDADGLVAFGNGRSSALIDLGFVDGVRKFYYFLLIADDEFAPRMNNEHDDFAWFTPDRLPMHVNRATMIAMNIGLVQKTIAATSARESSESNESIPETDYPDVD